MTFAMFAGGPYIIYQRLLWETVLLIKVPAERRIDCDC
jgi:hypothetical protein